MSATIFRSLAEARGRLGPCAVAIGNFDGVHVGHQQLIAATVRAARQKGISPAVITFDPHPTAVVAPNRVPLLICPLEERLRLIEAAGAERIFVLPFTRDIAQLSAEEFVVQILVEALAVKAVLVGRNFHFGRHKSGTPAVLEALGKRYHFETRFLDPVMVRGQVVSSTAVRTDLQAGRVLRAGRLLGRCFTVRGRVVSGRGIGSRETVPTLNLKPAPDLIAVHGIYVTETLERATGSRWPSVTSCGYNPTFGATDLTVETYVLVNLGGASPAEIEVSFRHFLRSEQTFPNAPALKAQILRDVARAEAYWRHVKNLGKTAPSLY